MERSSTASFYEADGLGSITSLSNSAGSLAQTYTFDSFGKQTAATGSLTNPFQYTARESDRETGLYYYRARYYDPGAGRFNSEDPLRAAGGPDFYPYARNNPVRFSDSSGLTPKDCRACPGGRWSGTGVSFGGIVLTAGGFVGWYKVCCWDKAICCRIRVECGGFGFGLGISGTTDSFWVWNAYSPNDLSGWTSGFAGGGGVGVVATGGSVTPPPGPSPPTGGGPPPAPPSSSTSASNGVGVGLGGGVLNVDCKTTVLSCKKK